MQRIVAVVLVILPVAPPASAGQKAGKPIGWERTQQLKVGTQMMITVTSRPPTKVRFLFADDVIVVTLKPSDPKLAGRVERTLFSIGSKWPAILNLGESIEDGRVRVSREGVFDGVQKVADLGELVQQTPRSDVLEIAEPAHSHRGRNILIGIGVLVAALFVAVLAAGPE